MKITAIRQQIRNAERVSVYLDGKYSFSLSLSQLVNEKLVIGAELDDDRIAELKEASQNEKLRMKAMNWVLLRPRSVRELELYLKRKESDRKSDGQWIIDDFVSRGWVDDEQFARWWIERSSRQKKSLSFLRAELTGKGVSRDIIGSVLAEKNDEAALFNLILKLRMKSKYKDEAKLARYLVTKGFRYSSVSDALALEGSAESLD
jgi:regulatory protein